MDFTKEALQHIEQQALAASGVRLDQNIHTPTIILRGDERLENIEHLSEYRTRFRGTYETTQIGEFSGYLGRHANGTAFVDPESMACTAIIDIGSTESPGHCQHVARLKLRQTALFAELCRLNGQRLTQQQMAEFLEDWRDSLTARRAIDATTYDAQGIADAIASVRKITIKSKSAATTATGDFQASRSALEEVEATSEKPLPAFIVAHCEPYIGMSSRAIAARLSVIFVDDKPPALQLRIVGRERLTEELATEFAELVRDKVPKSTTVLVGTFSPK